MALLSPVQGAAISMLDSLSAVRDAAEVSLKSFFGLLLDNTKELRKTLQDGNAVIDIVNTLRGAECEEAKFEPPTLKPATIAGPSGKLAITTGSCSLKRSADPLKLEYKLECERPGVAYEARVPRYTSRFVTAAKATTESCTVTRKYGVESEVVVTLINPADFFAAAAPDGDEEEDVEAAGGAANNSTGRLGVHAGAGWFKTLFPRVAGGLEGKKRLTFLPPNVVAAVEKAIKQSTVDLSLEYKPFTIKQDMIKQAANVAEALGQTFEVQQKLFKVYKDDLKEWADPEKKTELLAELDFSDNLREAMAKYNVSSLFDGMFAKTASHLMSKTKIGRAVSSKVSGAGEALLTERPLRTLLGKVREGAGQPVSIKLESGLEAALGQAMTALQAATGGQDGWSGLLPAAPRKGSLMERLLKNKGTAGHMQELQKIIENMGNLGAQLGGLKAAAGAGAAGTVEQGAAGAGDAADAVSGGQKP